MAAVLFAIIGALLGAGIAALWWCGHVLFGFPPIDEQQFYALMLSLAVLSQPALLAIVVWDECR